MGNSTYVFIDAQNLYLGVKKSIYKKKKKIYSGWEIDYRKLFVFLKEKYEAEKVFLFIGKVDKYKSLYKYLRGIGYILIFKDVSLYSKVNKITYK